jgi:hypothetical protein
MSGWVKIEKDLETDQRVRRIAKALCNGDALPGVTRGNAVVTQVVGGLTRLWVHADSHIREDDTLDMSAAEIDEWLGLPGFCAALPEDWLTVIDERTVELPGFQEHNGVEAKKRALTQKRVTRHRDKEKRSGVTAALPDQTKTRPRPDQTRPEGGEARAVRSPATRLGEDFGLTEERKAYATAERLDPERTFAKFTDYWKAASGAKARKHDWDATWRNWCRTETDRPSMNGAGKPHRRAKTVAELETEEKSHAAR